MATYTDIGIGTGWIFPTAGDGTFPSTDPVIPKTPWLNNASGAQRAKAWMLTAKPSIHGTYAGAPVTINTALAGSIDNIIIDGIDQLGGVAVPVVVGDPVATAAAVIVQLNAATPAVKWPAKVSGSTLWLSSPLTGSTWNNKPVSVNVTGLSVVVAGPFTSGGTDATQLAKRIFLTTQAVEDWSPPAVFAGATDISDDLAAMPPVPAVGIPITGTSIAIDRKGPVMQVNVTSAGTIDTIIMPDAVEGDTIRITNGAVGNVVIDNSLAIQIPYNVTLPDHESSLELTWTADFAGVKRWAMTNYPASLIPEALRGNGSQVPFAPNSTEFPMNLAGATVNLLVGTSDPPYAYITGTGALGAANFQVNITPGAGTLDGDNGWVEGATSGFSYGGAGVIVVNGITVPAAAAAFGRWRVTWRAVGAGGGATIVSTFVADSMTTGGVGTSEIADASVTLAKMAAGSVNASKVVANSIGLGQLDGQVQAMLSGSGIFTNVTTLVPSEVQALNSSPKTLVPAPGSGYAIVVEGWIIKVKWNSVAYAAFTDIEIGDFSAAVEQGRHSSILSATADTIVHGALQTTGVGPQITINRPLQVYNTGGDPTLGDSDVTITVWYRIIQA